MQANPVPESIDDRVRRRLRELRQEQGLTLQQVSDRANIDISMLSRLESGKRRLALDHIPGWPPLSQSVPTNCSEAHQHRIHGFVANRLLATA